MSTPWFAPLRNTLLACATAALLTACASGTPKWSYEGATGPERWGDLDTAWNVAKSGKQQSPVDIRGAQEMSGKPISIDYKPTPLDLVNNGHTIQMNYAPGSTLTLGEEVYTLKQFHFHTPSEHQVDGVNKAMEVHLVHKNVTGQLLVVGVLVKVGEANDFLGTFWGQLPPLPATFSKNADIMVDVRDLLPANLDNWRYLGSLTTPPCTEGVIWVVLQQPVPASATQVEALRTIVGRNNRPVQQLNGRLIKSVVSGAASGN